MASTWLTLAAGVALGGALASGLFLALGETRSAVVERAPSATKAEDRSATNSSFERFVATPSDTRVDDAARAPTEERAQGALISEELREYARAGLGKGWSSARKDAMPGDQVQQGFREFEDIVLATPERIGRELAEQRSKNEEALEDARTGGAINLLGRLKPGGVGPLPDLVGDPAAFEALFVRDTSEAFVPVGRDHDKLGDELRDGVTLSFPAGVFGIGNVLRDRGGHCPRDVTLAGAGMGATLIVLSDGLSCSGALRRFSIRDCTVFTDNHYLFNQYQGGVSLLLERVRVIGFDSGAGSSCCFSFNDGVALFARACRFEGGYGRWTDGAIFDVRTDALVARFEQCVVSNVSLGVNAIHPGATVVFESCALTDLHDDPSASSSPHPNFIFANTTIAVRPASQEPQHFDVDMLFPGWKERLQR